MSDIICIGYGRTPDILEWKSRMHRKGHMSDVINWIVRCGRHFSKLKTSADLA